MIKTKRKGFPDKYRTPFFLAVLLFFSVIAYGQTYTPGSHVVVNDAVAPSQPTPLDARSKFYDGTNFIYRAYNGTAEVLSYLNTTASRTGQFLIVVDSGGALQSNGTYIGGYNTFYMFKDSTTSGGLVKMNLFGAGVGSCSGCLLAANNLSDLSTLATALTNLGLNNVNNTSDATKNAATVSLTNHTISGAANTLTNIPNSALSNSTIGLTLNNTGTTPQVTTTPAALGASLVMTVPWTNGSDSGFLRGTDWTFFNGKLDSVRVSNDSVYNCVNGTCTLQSVISGTGGVNSVNGTNASLLFSPSTGNVLGQVNPAFTFNWSGQHTFVSFAPIFSTLTTAGGLFYGNGSGQLLQTGAGTSAEILESTGGTAPVFFTPNPGTVEGWLGYTPLSAALPSTQIYVGNSLNTAAAVNMSGDVFINNVGATTVQPNVVTNAKLAQMAGNTLKGNNTGGAANAADLTVTQANTMLGTPSGLFRFSDSICNTISGVRVCVLDSTGSGGGGTPANPTASIGLAVINGTASTYMRSDAAPPLSQAIAPTWSATHTFSLAPIFSSLTGYLKGNASSAITASATVPTTDLSGTLQAAQEPAHTGDVTNSAGSLALTITNNAVTNAKAAQMPGNTIKANNTGSTANAIDATPAQVVAMLPVFAATLQGVVPSPVTVTGKVLYDNGWGPLTTVIPTVGMGTLYSKSSFSSTSDFTAVGSFGLTTSSGELLFPSGTFLSVSTAIGTSNTLNQAAKITAYGGSMLERWKVIVGGKLKQAPSSTFGGPGIGLLSINAANASKPNTTIYLNASTNTGAGQLIIMAGANNTTVSVSVGALTLNSSDSFTISAERVEDVIYAVARDITNGGIVECNYRYDPTSSTNVLMPNTSNFDIATFGANAGGFSIDTINVTSLERKGANIAFLDDSKGRYATAWDLSATALLNRLFTNTINEGGEADATQDALNHLPEFIVTAPSTALVCIGRNDSSQGVSNATRNANLDTIVARLQRAGIQVLVMDGIYETLVSQTVYAAYIRSTFPNNFIPTLEAGTPYGASVVSPDNIHPNYLGAQVEVGAIKDNLVNNGKYVDGFNDGVRTNSSFDQINMYGFMRDVEATYPYTPTAHGIALRDGADIGAEYSGNFGRLILCNTTNTNTNIYNSVGGADGTGGGINLITPNGAANGTFGNASLRISGAGYLTTDGAISGFSAAAGSMYLPRGTGKIGAAATTAAGNESYFQPQDASNNLNIVNATKTGYINFSNANGASGGSLVKQMILDSLGFLTVHPQTFYDIAIIQGESTTKPQLGAFYNSFTYATLQVNSSGNLDVEHLTGITINSGALPTGTTTDSVLVETTASNIATIKKVAQSSVGGGATTVGAIGGPFTNAGSISGGTLTLGAADGTHGGVIAASGAQTLGATLTLSNALTVNSSVTASSGVNIAAKADLASLSGAGTIVSYAVPGSGSNNNFQIAPYINILAIVTDVIQVQVTFTGEDNASHTLTFFPQGLTSASISTTGYYALPPMFVSVKQGTTITVAAVFTLGTGSVTFDAGSIITKMY